MMGESLHLLVSGEWGQSNGSGQVRWFTQNTQLKDIESMRLHAVAHCK